MQSRSELVSNTYGRDGPQGVQQVFGVREAVKRTSLVDQLGLKTSAEACHRDLGSLIKNGMKNVKTTAWPLLLKVSCSSGRENIRRKRLGLVLKRNKPNKRNKRNRLHRLLGNVTGLLILGIRTRRTIT